MARERLRMRFVREILRLKQELRRSHREVARSLRVSVGTVASVLERAREADVDWEDVRDLADDEAERPVPVTFPPGDWREYATEVNLMPMGIRNVYLQVRFRVAGA